MRAFLILVAALATATSSRGAQRYPSDESDDWAFSATAGHVSATRGGRVALDALTVTLSLHDTFYPTHV